MSRRVEVLALYQLGRTDQAVALAMTGNKAELDKLCVRYRAAFSCLQSTAAFKLLTGPVEKRMNDGISH